MGKVHLYRKDSIFGFTEAITECGIIVDVDNVETIDPTKVKCERCKKTKKFKELERTHNEVMQIGADTMESYHRDEERRANSHKMAEMFEAEIAKDSEPKTYKQKIEIEIDVPMKMEVDTAKYTGRSYAPDFSRGTAFLHVSLKPKVKQGAELLHCLVGYSDISLDIAKDNTIDFARVGIVDGYNFSQNKSYRINGKLAMYAYPVPTEKLAELKANLEREV